MKILYTAEATATGDGRNGHTRSSDGKVDFGLAVPTEMGGPGGAGTNPEQLFAAGYAACFHGALRLVARRENANVDGSEVTAKVGIGATGTGGFGLAVELDVHLPNVDTATAESLTAKAHEVCPYSNATRNNIDVTLTVH
ncbi:MAG: organic hydroperoxide resistance protein [Mycobacteriales bacterium]